MTCELPDFFKAIIAKNQDLPYRSQTSMVDEGMAEIVRIETEGNARSIAFSLHAKSYRGTIGNLRCVLDYVIM